MKKTFLIVFLTITSLFSGRNFIAYAQAPLSVNAPKMMDVMPGVLYIKLKAKHGIDFEHLSPTHTGNAELDHLFANINVTDIYPFDPDAKKYGVSHRHGIDRMYVINFSIEGRSPRSVGHDFAKVDCIEEVSPRYIFQKCYIPNDPQIPNQYALDNTHMHILDAWGISEGNSNITIADLDEGVNYNHEDLAANIYHIDGHVGVDLVGSGTRASVTPIDFDPMPGSGQSHGTFTSGCFGAVADNGLGGAGSGFNCKIMIIKIANDAGVLLAGYEGIHYAVTHGAKILNCSWGGNEPDSTFISIMQSFVDEALDTGALIVAAAGNAGQDIDIAANNFFPANLKGVLSVGATDINDKAASFSNFGNSVAVYAPGVNIFSTTFPGNSSYDYSSGTSFSCPLTAGVAGLVWAKNPDWAPKFVTRQIIETCDNVVNPTNRTFYWGRVNAYTALSKPTVPGLGITDYKIDGVDKGGLNYLNKVYSIDVTFKNFMAAGSGIQVRLLPVDGYVAANGDGYSVQQTSTVLGSMNSQQQGTGSFKFTRDTTDNGAGSQLPLYFAVSYGTSTIEGAKYYDTLILNVNIIGDNIYVTQGVAQQHSNILQLGNTYPNPISSDATITFELVKQSYAKLSVSDVFGRTLSVLSEGIFDNGSHNIHVDAHLFENGVYLYKLETSDGTVMTKRFVVIH
jgi:serine protease